MGGWLCGFEGEGFGSLEGVPVGGEVWMRGWTKNV